MPALCECLRSSPRNGPAMLSVFGHVPPPVEILQSDLPWYQRFCSCRRHRENGSLLNEALAKPLVSASGTLDRIKTIKYIERYPSVMGDARNLRACLENLGNAVDADSPEVVIASADAIASLLEKHGSKMTAPMIDSVLKTAFEQLMAVRIKVRNRFIDVIVLLLKQHPSHASSHLLYLVQRCDVIQTVCAMEALCRVIRTRYYLKLLPLKCIFHFFSVNADSKDPSVRSYATKGITLMDFYF
ncbi:hypothetical protein HPB48_011717 [Haemaphysalis longicornis]|uniref:Uncharacterized protein n=1 Tax=Haemaphysalis longicornis TaxID=44386 RepID=A0A9J6H2A7_HAELO|nr:hypothetical protein HPB48_011717 [Haemaphysalis longicornis]